ncbi:TIGR02099 family protein [Halomonas sp. McH1-25]|uniref:YhdP family protein n=2 Tax=Halomonas TaxID=2745 RepID=UPI001EF47B72|nr:MULTISPECIES: YhdP family protein [unclassified Halomonas]MCG7599005.1 TIGR02099 family protein [Halomonas sp. McH1-25]MCP1360348.1 TIGR02099 family protein [Halomonas sp. BBD45]MCP1364585.1 TIGR02099 family protein [Halomonas sp. BBD48]
MDQGLKTDMATSRIVLRWVLTLLAIGLAVVALLSVGVRVAMFQSDVLRDELSAWLTGQFNASMQLGQLDSAMHGLDPSLAIEDLQLISHAGVDPYPLLDIEQASARLDMLASLRAGYPVLTGARIEEATLHLYQDRQGNWSWPAPAKLPNDIVPDSDFAIGDIDQVTGLLLRQRLQATDIQVVLHGIDDSVTLTAPRVVMTSGGQGTHLEGSVFVEGEREQALEFVLETTPGDQVLEDYRASLQLSADLSALSRLGRLVTRPMPLSVETMQGRAVLWGGWENGRLQDAHAELEIAGLDLGGTQEDKAALQDVGARVQWLRGEQDNWQAWATTTTGGEAPAESVDDWPVPRHFYAKGNDQSWTLRSSAFDIGELAAWGRRLIGSSAVTDAIAGLDPAGQVDGLSVGWRQGQWQAQALLENASVSAWQGAPGGGPFDAWVDVAGNRGHVTFTGVPGMALSFPEIFEAPLVVDGIAGQVSWTQHDGAWRIVGDELEAVWRGAEASGGFSLVTSGENPGEFELRLDLANVDAIDTPLMAWLPAKVLDPDLREWLGQGIAGRVPQGSLYVQHTLDDDSEMSETGEEESFDGKLRLNLQVEDGRLPFDPQWPALENVNATLTVEGESLHADIAHAEVSGLVSEGASVTLQDELLRVEGAVNGSSQALLDFLAASPLEGMDTFATWRSEGQVQGQLSLQAPMVEGEEIENSEALDIDVEASLDVPSLTLPQSGLTLGNLNGRLHYRHTDNQDTLTGELGARAFDGPLLAQFDVGGKGVTLEGRALARGLLAWADMPELDNLLVGYFPYTAHLELDGEQPSLTLDSDLQGLAILLPAPFGKQLDERVPLHVESTLGESVQVDVAERIKARWRTHGERASQGQVWLERWPASPDWPSGPGWDVVWRSSGLPLARWKDALASVSLPDTPEASSQPPSALRRVVVDTGCLRWEQRCLGSLNASLSPLEGGWRVGLSGSLVNGSAEYHPQRSRPLDIVLSTLSLDALLPEAPTPEATGLLGQVATPPEPAALPATLARLPAGHVSIDSLQYQGRQVGSLTASWDATAERVSVKPLSLTLGEVTAEGEVVWESSGTDTSLTRSRIALSGGDLGTLIAALGQPVPLRSESTQVQTQLAWPGAPWQFALERSRGSIEAELDDGRFLTLESPSARLVGLLNVDNLLRRLRLDFSDVTGQGTAFDSVTGSATLYDGRLETRGPIEIDGSSTQFTLEGSVNLAARQLDLLLGITLPVSQNLPLAAVLIGAPYVGGALFLADKVFGGWIDKVTRIHYRVQGPWTSPQITLENAE